MTTVANIFFLGPSGQGWAASRSQDTHAEVLFGFTLASLFQAWGRKRAGASVLHFESKRYVKRVLDHFCHKTEEHSKVIGFRVPLKKKIYFSQKKSVCQCLCLWIRHRQPLWFIIHGPLSARDSKGWQIPYEKGINCNHLLLWRLDTHLLQMYLSGQHTTHIMSSFSGKVIFPQCKIERTRK